VRGEVKIFIFLGEPRVHVGQVEEELGLFSSVRREGFYSDRRERLSHAWAARNFRSGCQLVQYFKNFFIYLKIFIRHQEK
jgi:hypothetical protein